MRTKVTLILLLLNVALFSYIYYNRHDIAAKDSLVLGPETSNIHSLVIATTGTDASVRKIERGTDVAWTLVEPLQWPANEFAVNRIVSELQQLRPYASFTVEEIQKVGQTLADFGLENPPLTLTYTPASAAQTAKLNPITVKIGSPTPAGNRIYILSPDGQTIHVVNRSLAESLALRLDDLRSDTLFSIPVFEVRTFKLQRPAPAASTSINNENNRWVFQSPFKANDVRANKAATVIAINKLQALRVKEFVDPRTIDNTRTGLGAPSLQIALIGNNRRETLLLGAQVEPATDPTPTTNATPAAADGSPTLEYYAKMEDKTPVFKIALSAQLHETLLNAQEKLRDSQVLDFDPANVTTLTLSAPNTPQVTLQRLDPTSTGPTAALWQVVRHNGDRGPQTYPADRARIEKLLEQLARLSAERFVNDAPTASDLEDYGFNRPTREISLTLAHPQPGATGNVITLQIGEGSRSEPFTFARLSTQPYIYRVASAILGDTPVSALAYRDRLLRELPAGAQISGLKITDRETNSLLLDVTLPLAAPAANDPVLPPQRRAAIETLASQLRSLRAKNLLREEFPNTVAISGQERPWRYRLDTAISLVGGTGTQTTTNALYFSERAGGTTQFAGSPELSLLFEAEQPLIDALFAIVFGPKDPGAPEPHATPSAP